MKDYIFPCLLYSFLVISIPKNAYTQRLISDTITAYTYDVFCEEILVIEYFVPDSIYAKYKGRTPENGIKYERHRYPLGYNKKGECFGYKDFILQIGGENYEFSYPQYSYDIRKKDLLNALKDAQFYNVKTEDTFELKYHLLKVGGLLNTD